MPFKVPVKNPGRYFEQFIKIVQHRGGESMQWSNHAVQFSGMDNQPWKSNISNGTEGEHNNCQGVTKPANIWQSGDVGQV